MERKKVETLRSPIRASCTEGRPLTNCAILSPNYIWLGLFQYNVRWGGGGEFPPHQISVWTFQFMLQFLKDFRLPLQERYAFF